MARGRNRAGSPGWPSALGGALLLVALGFILGMAAGVAIEAPGLLMDHLAGRSSEAPLAPPEGAGRAVDSPASPGAADSPPGARARALRPPPSAAERAASAAPARRRTAASSAAAPAAPAARAAPPAASAAQRAYEPAPIASAGRFSVQVGAFARADSARGMAGALRADGVPAQVVDMQRGRARYKVRVGPLATQAEAQRMAKRLERERGLDTWVVAGERR